MTNWIFLVFFFFVSLGATEPVVREKKHAVAICAIFQNEARFLKEWVEYHYSIGVDHFYLYNNLSADHYKEVLNPYRKKGIITLIDWPYPTNADGKNWPVIQTNAYMDNLPKAKKEAKWIAYLDTDEFIVPMKGGSLPAILEEYKAYGGVCLNWQCYGTSGVAKVGDNEWMMTRLVYRGFRDNPMNLHVKSIVQPSRIKSIKNPHNVVYRKDYYQVNERKERFEGPFSPYVSVDKIRINHYWTRDEEFFYNVKIPRREKWGGNRHHLIEINNALNQVKDPVIVKFKP